MSALWILMTVVLCLYSVSCSGSGETETQVPDYELEVDMNNLNGFAASFKVENGASSDGDPIFGYVPSTNMAEIALKRISDIEKKMNCTLDITYDPDKRGLANGIMPMIASGLYACDVLMDGSEFCLGLMEGGYLERLSLLIDVTDTEKWGTPTANMCLFWKDDQYGVLPAMWPDLYYTSVGYPFCVNENIVAAVGGTDPRDYVENNTWTWDRFEDCIELYTFDSSAYRVYGCGTQSVYFAQMMFRSNGDRLLDIHKATDDPESCGYYTGTAFEALSRTFSMLFETHTEYFYPSNDRFLMAEKFIAGELGIVCSNTQFIFGSDTSYVYNCDNFGILPAPQGPDAIPGDYGGCNESMEYSIMIPITCRDSETVAFLVDALFEPFDEYKTKQGIIDYMADTMFFDRRDAEVFYKMVRNTEYAFYVDGGRGIIETIVGYNGSPQRVAEALEKNRSLYAGVYTNKILNHLYGIRAVWGDDAP